ncbi:hypothetical protein GCM10011579_036300 [Streptomyces albiflavescens]|uniref:Uncharacterized protein n=1 Tax=Streptomyces albiflavescens TaxID=1623582 RepID=A0A918D4U1_9ACTN|nr:hypothetical protein [Streptomyces albiflavescens]GGN65651.1 hypothetical protein GCM10011579_036300 [Streptomyces albiflavescens]
MPGTVLLLAASPVGKGCLVDAASVLPVLAAVSPAVLSGTDTASVVELADPLEPQAVLTRLRAAATAPGPLTVFVTGQLQLDRRQHLPHLALARTTPATVRYTAFPWHWITEELRLRPPGTTTLFVDLHADAESWDHLVARPLTAGPAAALYGRVAPPPPRRTVASPTYMRAVATILRSGYRPPLPQLHQQALTRVSVEGARTDMVLAPGAPMAEAPPVAAPLVVAPPVVPPPPLPAQPPAPPADPHETISAAVQAGRHDEAEALAGQREQEALRTYGPASETVLHWMEVRADLAMFAGDAERSCRTWLAIAGARLNAGQAPESPAVEAAVDRAHHQWGRIEDTTRARELGPMLADVRLHVPGRRQGALDHVQQQLRRLELQTQA